MRNPDAARRRVLGGGGGNTLALTALLTIAALLALQPARADGHPDDIQLILSIDDSDRIVRPAPNST